MGAYLLSKELIVATRGDIFYRIPVGYVWPSTEQ